MCAFFAPRRARLLYSPRAAEMDIGPVDMTDGGLADLFDFSGRRASLRILNESFHVTHSMTSEIPLENRVGPAQRIDPAAQDRRIGVAQSLGGAVLRLKGTL